jgi:hypothetical protein
VAGIQRAAIARGEPASIWLKEEFAARSSACQLDSQLRKGVADALTPFGELVMRAKVRDTVVFQGKKIPVLVLLRKTWYFNNEGEWIGCESLYDDGTTLQQGVTFPSGVRLARRRKTLVAATCPNRLEAQSFQDPARVARLRRDSMRV